MIHQRSLYLSKKTRMIYFIMGVSGAGKTSIGTQLAKKLALPFLDGDDFHPKENVLKMKSGKPLEDQDRMAWLLTIGREAKESLKNEGAVIACSALKEKYRKLLTEDIKEKCQWIFLKGSFDLIDSRLKKRQDHFMPPHLLQSQFDALEIPEYAFHVDIDQAINKIVSDIIIFLGLKNNMQNKSKVGIVGLGVMGKSLSLNLIDHGFKLSLYNRHALGLEENVAKNFIRQNIDPAFANGFDELKAFVDSLEQPRKILMMVKAGKTVDGLLDDLILLLDKNDIIIDGGNEHYKVSKQRNEKLALQGIHYFGCGISGGEEGARKGPSIMPGGSEEIYPLIADVLETIAAKDKNGNPCCSLIGPAGAGHFVKMVHNGIEYAEMQLLAEVYQLAREVNQQKPDEIATLLEGWKQFGLNSYLLEITIDILRKKDGEDWLIDKVLDKAENKGTGSWTTIAACELGVATPMISAALFARYTSSLKGTRKAAATIFPNKKAIAHKISNDDLRKAYDFARIINHHQGFALIAAAAKQYKWPLDLSEIARIWTNGCIIRSDLMETLVIQLKENSDLLLNAVQVAKIPTFIDSLYELLKQGLEARQTLPCFSAAQNYLSAYFQERSNANIIQAQRDYFGAHKYQRNDDPSGKYYHSIWKS